MPLSNYALIQNEDGLTLGSSSYMATPTLLIDWMAAPSKWGETWQWLFNRIVNETSKYRTNGKLVTYLFGDVIAKQAVVGLSQASGSAQAYFESMNDGVYVKHVIINGDLQTVTFEYCSW